MLTGIVGFRCELVSETRTNFVLQTPFWANNHSDMYYRVLQDELQFPEDRTMDQDTKSLIRGVRCSTFIRNAILTDMSSASVLGRTGHRIQDWLISQCCIILLMSAQSTWTLLSQYIRKTRQDQCPTTCIHVNPRD